MVNGRMKPKRKTLAPKTLRTLTLKSGSKIVFKTANSKTLTLRGPHPERVKAYYDEYEK